MSSSAIAGAALLGSAVLFGLLALGPRNVANPDLVGARRLGVKARMRRISRSLESYRSGLRLNRMLETSGRQIRSGEWIAMLIIGAAVLAVPVYFLRGILAAVLSAVFVVCAAHLWLGFTISRRQREFAEQLPELLQQMSSTIRSGLSLPQAIAQIATDLPAPAGVEMRRVAIEHRIGRTLSESLDDLAERMDSQDLRWAVRAIDINRRTGGDLARILRRLDATIRARNHVRGHVRSLTAEGRLSGLVLTLLPPILLLAISLVNPDFLDPLFDNLVGQLVLIVSTILLITGGIWLFRLARFRF